MSGPIFSREEWRRLEPLVDAVLDAPRERRDALIAELTGGDAARRAELERLVAECEREYPLLETPAAERFPYMLLADDPPMPETIGDRYRIVREAGRGGMAVVWLAHDLKHGRDVAIKVVRPELAAAIGRERFLREIEIAARLRHPLIVPLYDSGEVASAEGEPLLYYVMPYEAGQSLRALLERDGPLPVAEVVGILRDLCEALAYAHGQGIVHLDIKPDNVMLSGGHALITDFGIARAASAVDGAMAGTPTYMAPEQMVPGARVDHRADIWALGALAHELLVGRPPGPDAPAPPELAGMVARCLEEDPANRWQSADELRAALDRVAAADSTRGRSARISVLLGAGAVAIALGAVAIVRAREGGGRDALPALAIGRAVRLTSDPGLEVQPSISPDGGHIAYAAGGSQRMHVFVRPTRGGAAVRLTTDTTGNEWSPRWSPDGARVLFLANGGAFSAPAAGGEAAREEVAERPGAIVTSAAWSPDGREIAYVRGDSLLALASGDRKQRLITNAPDLHSCAWSPDGARIACVSGNAFYVTVGAQAGAGPMFGNLAPSRIVLVPASGGRAEAVTDGGSLHQSPAWSRDGATLYFVSNREGPRDVYALDVSPGAPRDRKPVRVTTGMDAQSMDLSRDGKRVVYAVYASSANVWAMPIPTRGVADASTAVQVTTGNQTVEGVRVSPDGRWLLYDSGLGGSSDVYRVPIVGGEPERLTSGMTDEFRGALSPDGKELAYHTFESGARSLFVLALGGGPARQLTHPPAQGSMANWSPDGSALALFDIAATKVLVMRRDGRGRWSEPRFVGGRGWRPEWSPDGRTIAFVSPGDGRIGVVPADSGTPRDVYVPDSAGPSAELAIFSADGRELYFKSHDARGRASFWAIPVSGGRPRLLARFDDPARASNRFEFASDGRRFYFTVEDRESDIWVAEVARR